MTYALDANVREGFQAAGADIGRVKATVGPGIGDYPNLAAAVAANPGGSVRLNYDATALPADFAGVLLEYTKQATARGIGLTSFNGGIAQRTLRAMFPESHAGQQYHALNIEAMSLGSGINGPSAVENALTLNSAKKGFATGTARGGAFNGMYIYGRQDGPKGLPIADPGRSDYGGIIGNFTVVEDAGWCGGWESTTTQINGPVAKNGYAAFEQMRQLQTAFGVIYSAVDRGDRAYGFSVVANKGNGLTAAFYAGKASTASWDAVLLGQDVVKIDGNGNYRSLHHAWPDGALIIERDKILANGNASILHRGTGSLRFLAMEAANLSFGTGGVIKFRLQGDGNIVPATGETVALGHPTSRFSAAYLNTLNVAGAITLPTNMPVYADNAAALAGGLTAGRVYRTSTGQMMVAY